MILCDNIIFELQSLGGISKYWSKTISQLDASTRDIAFLEGPGSMGNRFRCELELKKPIMQERGSTMLRRLRGPSINTDVFHSSYYRISHRARSNVVTIHDFMNEKYPVSYRDRILAAIKKRACGYAQAIVVVSERTRQDLLRHYSFVDSGRVHVTYNGVGKEYYPEPLHIPFEVGLNRLTRREYFLYVGTRGHCKNFTYVLRFMAEAQAQGLDLPLIIAGGGLLTDAELAEATRLGLSHASLKQISDLSDATLRRLYSNCLALLIPSIYEGFGLPAAEAARCGAMVLSARGSALDEIVGETDYAFELHREGEVARVLALGLDNAYADSERSRVQGRSSMFNWEASAQKLMEIYDEL